MENYKQIFVMNLLCNPAPRTQDPLIPHFNDHWTPKETVIQLPKKSPTFNFCGPKNIAHCKAQAIWINFMQESLTSPAKPLVPHQAHHSWEKVFDTCTRRRQRSRAANSLQQALTQSRTCLRWQESHKRGHPYLVATLVEDFVVRDVARHGNCHFVVDVGKLKR